MGSVKPDVGSERADFSSERLDIGSGRPDLGSEWPDLRSERPDLGSERPNLRLWEGGDGTETGKNCPMWDHRSSAPPGPLPKKEDKQGERRRRGKKK